MLHLIMGLPGTGKSEASKYLSEKLDAVAINTDKLHSLLFPNGERTDTGDFTPEQLAEIYRCLKPLAYYLSVISPDKHFIMEGSFRFKSQRDFITQELDRLSKPYRIVLVTLAKEESAKERITRRHVEDGAPDTFEDYLKIKNVFEFPENAIEIDNSDSLKELYSKLEAYIQTL